LELAAADATSRAAAIAARAAAADTDVTFTDADAALGCCGGLNGTALGRAGDFTGAFPGGAKR